MLLVSQCLALILAAAALRTVFHVRSFACLYDRNPSETFSEGEWPHAAVILPVRGADPFLAECIERLSRQDYEHFDVYVVLDSQADEAWPVVDSILENLGADKFHLVCTETIFYSCTPRQSGLIHVVEQLDDSVKIIVTVDGDAVTYDRWLSDLIAPFADPDIGGTSGVRWFMPESSESGTLVRHLWNAAAIPAMKAFRIMWGGSLALRKEIIDHTDMLERWRRCLFEDVQTDEVVRKAGYRTCHVGDVTLVNRESITLGSTIRYIRRQMINAWLYHPYSHVILLDGVISSLAVFAALAVQVAGAATANVQAVAWAGSGLLIYTVVVVLCLGWCEYHVRKAATVRGESIPPFCWKTLRVLFLTQGIYFYCCVSAMLYRRVEWRGLHYQFTGPWDVSLLDYQPYRRQNVADPTQSL